MCDVNGPFKLCTCSEKIDKKKPYWVLKSNRKDEEETDVLGMFSQPNPLFTPILRKNILRRLNSVKSIFDFEYNPEERDLLKLYGEYDEYYCEYTDGKWKWLENNGEKENWFLHVNMWDPHTPYDTPKEFGNTFKKDPTEEWVTEELIKIKEVVLGLIVRERFLVTMMIWVINILWE